MIFIELVILIAVLFIGGSVGVKLILDWSGRVQVRSLIRDAHSEKKWDDLRNALKSGDHRKLDDFIVMWSHELQPKVLSHVRGRRDELYIEADEKKK